MKKIKIIILLINLAFLQNVYAQERLFLINNESDICATINKENTQVFDINEIIYRALLENKEDVIILDLPFFDRTLTLKLIKFDVYSADLSIYSKTDNGDSLLSIKPSLLSYKIYLGKNNIGVLNFVNNKIVGTFQIEKRQYEITKFKGKYILFESSNSINSSNFSCAVESAVSTYLPQQQIPSQSSNLLTPVCVELAIEIDQYTRLTFASDLEAVNWALAIMAGVSQIYESETNAAIQVTYSYVWNTTDPYNSWVAQSSLMLTELKNYWTSNNAGISRDLVHLLTKRTNTGTGGIAYVDVLCDNVWGYGFSADLNNDTTYSFPNPTYTWNLNVCSHEIGHNFKSRHTHWCGWAADPLLSFTGGVIDNCVDVEGSCSNNPSAQIGTIMSYCHTTFGGGIALDFHEVVVSQALDVGIANATCLTTCDYYGCTDPTMFNYDPNATIDDGSCIPKIFGCIDILATNYDPIANTDDGSCTYCSEVFVDITDISCNGFSDGAIDITIINGVSPYLFTWTGPNGFTASTEDISNISSAGNFQLIVEDALACMDTTEVTMVMPSLISIVSTVSDSVSCNGLNDGGVSINVDGGTPPFTFTSLTSVWSDQQCYAISDGLDPTTNWEYKDFVIPNGYKLDSVYFDATRIGYPLDQHDFVFEYCPSSLMYSSVIAIEPFNYTSIATSMYNVWIDLTSYNIEDSTTVRVSLPTIAGATWNNLCFAISPDNFFNTFNSSASLPTGTYSTVITDVNNCPSVNSSFTIGEPDSLESSIVKSDISCYNQNDGSVDLIVSGGTSPFTCLWSGPSGFSSISEDLSSLAMGQYFVQISDVNGCNSTDFIEINNPSILASNPPTTQDVSCNGGTDGSILLNISGGTPPYNYLWSNGSGSQNLINISADNYSVDIADSNGCVLPTVYATVFEPNPSSVSSASTDVSCFGYPDGTIDVTYQPINNLINYSFLWSDGSTNEDLVGLTAGLYNLIITENNNCYLSVSVVINQPDELVVQDSTDNVNCKGGNDGSAYLSVSGGTPFYSYTWNNGANTFNLNNLAFGTYSYVVTDLNQCVFNGSVNIFEPATSIVIVDSVIDASCFNSNDGAAYLSITGGGSPYQVNWLNSSPGFMGYGSHLFELLDGYGCLMLDSVFVDHPSEISIVESVMNAKCYNEASGSVSLMISGGHAPYVTNWYGFDINNLLAGSYIYEVADSNSCVKSSVVVVSEPSEIVVSNTVSPATCVYLNDGSVSINILGGIPPYYTDWFGNNPQQLDKGMYDFVVVDSNLCIDSNQVFIYSISDIQVQEEITNVSCFNNCDGKIGLLISNGFAPYQVELQDINGIPFTADSLCGGEYTYKVIDDLMCEFIDTFSVVNPELIQLSISVNANILEANVSGGVYPYYYSWFDTTTYIGNTPELTVNYNGEFTCVVYDSNYCFTDSITINTSQMTVVNNIQSSFLVYPNPIRDILNIESSRKISNMYMTDVLGKRLKLTTSREQSINKIDCSRLAKGIYFLNFDIIDKKHAVKVIVE